MPVTTLTVQEVPENTALDDFTFAAMDNVNNNDFPATGKEMIVVRNDDAGAQTVVVNSSKCSHGREGDITMSPAAANYSIVGPLSKSLYQETNGNTLLTPSAATLKVAIVRFVPAAG